MTPSFHLQAPRPCTNCTLTHPTPFLTLPFGSQQTPQTPHVKAELLASCFRLVSRVAFPISVQQFSAHSCSGQKSRCYLFFFFFFLAVLGLRFCARAFSSCGKRGPLFIAVRRPFTVAASLVAEHRLQTRRLSSCGARAQLLRGMWDLPRPEIEPVSPALAGGFSNTLPPGEPWLLSLTPQFL